MGRVEAVEIWFWFRCKWPLFCKWQTELDCNLWTHAFLLIPFSIFKGVWREEAMHNIVSPRPTKPLSKTGNHTVPRPLFLERKAMSKTMRKLMAS
jgi:hypothetical protein